MRSWGLQTSLIGESGVGRKGFYGKTKDFQERQVGFQGKKQRYFFQFYLFSLIKTFIYIRTHLDSFLFGHNLKIYNICFSFLIPLNSKSILFSKLPDKPPFLLYGLSSWHAHLFWPNLNQTRNIFSETQDSLSIYCFLSPSFYSETFGKCCLYPVSIQKLTVLLLN